MKLSLILFLSAVATLSAQHGVEGLSNPYATPEDAAAGGLIFRSHCAACHGAEGEGGRAPALNEGRFRRGSSDSELYAVISEGITGTEMPGTFFEGRQLWQIVAYVRSLSEGRGAGQTRGDAARGKGLFEGKGGCLGCHMVGGHGSRSGPDLTDIGSRRSLAHLESAVLRPNEKVLPEHRSVRVVTRDGVELSGPRLNEDTYSVQMLDSDGRLASYLKQDLAEYEVILESTMPSYEGAFTSTEFDDLIAYLASLKK